MSQDAVAVHHQDVAETYNEVAHDQPKTHLRDASSSEATQAIKANASTNLTTPPGSNNDDIVHNSIHQTSPEEHVFGINYAVARVTSIPQDSSNLQYAMNGTSKLNQVIPSTAPIVRPSSLPRDTTPPPPPPSSNTTTLNTSDLPHSSFLQQQDPDHPALGESLAGYVSHTGAVDSSIQGNKMIFGSGTSRPSAAHRRRNLANTNAVTEEEADLTSKDRAKQKEAVKRYLSENVRDDWTWEWPRPAIVPTAAPDSTKDSSWHLRSKGWKERDEWSDNASEGGSNHASVRNAEMADPEKDKGDPFRFDSPDGVGEALHKIEIDTKRRRKKRLADEMAWNDGLRCFSQRRDAWTGARRVHRSASLGFTPITKQQTSTSFSSEDGGSSTAIEQEEESEWEADTEIPIAPPFIPAENGMRKMITPANYSTIYDKVILNQITPLCPINLKDITKSCVKGWQRDGEWAPASNVVTGGKNRRKMSVAGLFGLDRPEEKADITRNGNGPERRTASPANGIRGKLGKILHLRRDSTDRDNERV